MPFSLASVSFAILLSLCSAGVVFSHWHASDRGVLVWTTSLVLGWGLAAALWLPWIDHAKSYRSMYLSMRSSAAYRATCVSSFGLGESERAMLDYVLNVKTKRIEVTSHSDCPMLLVQGITHETSPQFGSKWHRVWVGSRPGDSREKFELFARNPTAPVAVNAEGHNKLRTRNE